MKQKIESLFGKGITEMRIGVPPDGSINFYMGGKQGVVTGDKGNFIEASHQVTGESLDACLDALHRQVDAANSAYQEPSPIHVVKPNGRI